VTPAAVASRFSRTGRIDGIFQAVGSSLVRDEESLQKQRSELSRRLVESRQRVVVMVDDIDRREDDEIKQVLAAVIAVSRLQTSMRFALLLTVWL
jgi:predicted KAP-like P-loop ATPase